MPDISVQTDRNVDSAISTEDQNLSPSQINAVQNASNFILNRTGKDDRGVLVEGTFGKETSSFIDFHNPKIKQDEGYLCSRQIIHDETNVKYRELDEKLSDIKRLKKCILEGDWTEVDKICSSKSFIKNQKSFLYAVYKQQYLELLEVQEIQKAFSFLLKRLKPLENLEMAQNEFKDLCYLITAKSINEATVMSDWEGIQSGREKLVDQLQTMVDIESIIEQTSGPSYVPPKRLEEIFNQAAAFQISNSKYHLKTIPEISTLLEDYSSFIVPNALLKTFTGHEANVKCLCFVGLDGASIASGSSDNSVKVWDIESGQILHSLVGHSSRVWDVCSHENGSLIVSGSGDGTVKLWDLKYNKSHCAATLKGAEDYHGDIYTVDFHPGYGHVAAGGYDKVVRLFDINYGKVVKSFFGHELAISKAVFNPMGNLLISGSKDCTFRIYDVISGICVKMIDSYLGEISSLRLSPDGLKLLTCTKDNCNRLWDLRMMRPIRKFKGHQNTSKNFIGCNFLGDHLISGGSEDGMVYLWDLEKGDIIQKLKGHGDMVYDCIWNKRSSKLVSCSEDCTLKVWCFDPSRPLYSN